AQGGFSQYEALKTSADASAQALIARGVPEAEAQRVTRIWHNQLADGSKYYIDQIAHDTATPGVVINGESFPESSPHLWVEAMNPKVYL
ncbi:hypothetical protein NL526_28205, partial [Klebsiella pneumoniae]|nr:hypothetical protein [Klebsiella pneumoniae]